jgi:PAS domain S-box-containing protein
MSRRDSSGPRGPSGARTPLTASRENDVEALRERLREAEETIAAIRAGDVDAVVAGGPAGETLYRLDRTDYVDLFEHSIVGEFVTWPSGGVKANAAFCRMLGYAREELESRTWRDITHPEDVERTERALEAIRAGERASARFVKRYVRKDGAVVWADESTSLRRDPTGRPLYFVSSAIDVTESHRAQEALLASEVRYRRLFESAKDGILILDFASGRIVDSNPFLEQLTGFTKEELKGRTVWEIGMFSDAPDSRMAFETLRSNEYVRYEDLPLRDRAGNAVEVEFISNTYLVGGAKVIQCNIRDISERKRLEAELRRKDVLYLSVIENSTDLILLVDQDATVRFTNPALEPCLGYAASDVVGTNVFDYFHPEEREQARRDLEAGARDGFPEYPRVRRIRHKDGSWRSFEYAAADLLQNPEVRGIVAVCRDVTERQRFEAALAASERRYRLLAEQNLAGLLRTTVDGRILDCNPAAVRIFGYEDAAELKTRHAADLYSDAKDRATYIDRLVDRGTAANVEIAGVRKDGGRITLLENGSLWEDDELGAVVVRTFFDVTDRVQLEAQHRQLQKMEAIGALAAGLAHDFNNILTVVGGYAAELLRDLSEGSRAHRYATEIGSATQRAAVLTRQLLTFSRRQVLVPRVLELNAILGSIHGLLGRLLGEDTEVVLDLQSRLGFVMADPVQLEQVMLNLAVNARDAMPGGGRFVVATRDVDLDETSVRTRPSLAAGAYVLLEVSDTGTGMTPEVLTHVFEPFFTTKEVGKIGRAHV